MTDEEKSRLPITYLRKVPADVLGTVERTLMQWAKGEDIPSTGMGGICLYLGAAIGCYGPVDTPNLDIAHTHMLDWAEHVWIRWDKYSGSMLYPVPVHGFTCPGRGFNHHHEVGTLWKGDQLFLRQKLCKHLLAELSKDLVSLKAEWAAKE
jgi:hypothetical protein